MMKTELLKSISFLLLSVGKKVCNVSAVVETVCAYTGRTERTFGV